MSRISHMSESIFGDKEVLRSIPNIQISFKIRRVTCLSCRIPIISCYLTPLKAEEKEHWPGLRLSCATGFSVWPWETIFSSLWTSAPHIYICSLSTSKLYSVWFLNSETGVVTYNTREKKNLSSVSHILQTTSSFLRDVQLCLEVYIQAAVLSPFPTKDW